MAYGLVMQLEPEQRRDLAADSGKPWRRPSRGWRLFKTHKARAERRRAREDPECPPHYGRFHGFEY